MNGCYTSRLLGFVGECVCGESGPIRHLRNSAADDLAEHKREAHGAAS